MKYCYRLILYPTVFLYQMQVQAEDCLQQVKKNCVDLCIEDPGNRLNRRIESRVKLSEVRDGSCKITDHGETYQGDRITTKYKSVYFEVCQDLRYEKIEIASYCNE